MSSPEQSDGNGRNGAQSNGPTAPEGEAASSKNAIKPGLLSSEILMPYEDPNLFREFSWRLWEALSPNGDLESLLFDRIVALGWRLERWGQVEAGILEYWIRQAAQDSPARGTFSVTLGRAFVYDCSRRNSLAKLSRCESTMERSLFRCLHELQRLQAARKGECAPQPEVADTHLLGASEPVVRNERGE
jgi:hypothetical protein